MSGYVTGTGNRTTADGTWTYTYDDAGQMTGKGTSGEAWAYTYDHAGRTTGASKSASPGGTVTDSVSYKLDAWGNRIERGQAGTATATERYAVDGWDTAKPGAVGTEGFEAAIDLDGSNAVTSRRVFGAGFDEAVARQDAGGAVSWYGADAQGTVRQVFDNSGNSIGSRAFTGFRVVTATSGTGLDRYAYTGTVTDPLTGLVGDDARQYDPTLGKWTSDDPIGFGGGDYNVSRTVGNAATTATDPSGLWGSYITDWLAKQTQGQHEAVHVPAVFVAGLVRNLDLDRHLGDAAAEAARGNTRPLEAMRNGADFYQMGDDYTAARTRGDNVAASASMAVIRNNILSAPFLGFYEAGVGEHTGGVRHGQLLTEDEIAEKYTGGVIATFAAAYGGPKGTLGRTRGIKTTTVTSPALPAAEVVTTQLETVVIDGKPTVVQVTRTGVGRGPSIVPPAATGGVADAALPRPALPAPTPSGTCPAPAPVAHVASDGTRFATATERFLYEEATGTGKGSQVGVAPTAPAPITGVPAFSPGKQPLANPGEMVEAVRQLETGTKAHLKGDILPPTHRLTELQQRGLKDNTRAALDKADGRLKSGDLPSDVASTLEVQLRNPRFRFLDQIPDAKQAVLDMIKQFGPAEQQRLFDVLRGHGVKVP